MSDQKRLFLVDAYALIFRGYYAFIKRPSINSKGINTSAIVGFMNSLLDVIKRERPDHLAVCFDKGASHERVSLYESYKANRDETPEGIQVAVPYIKAILRAMHIPIMQQAGYEADDVIGTLAKQAERAGYKIFMVTPDKDFAQLVSEQIFMYRPMFGGGYETWGIAEVQQKFGVKYPIQVIDFLGMMGDSSDNIPGLPGVGEKTAKKFLAQYGSMENLLANTHELKGKMKEKIETNSDLGILSKKLATILLDVPVQFHADDFKMSLPDTKEVVTIFEDLEFRRLTDNFLKTFQSTAPQKAVSETPLVPPKKTDDTSDTQPSLFDTPTEKQTAQATSHYYQSVTTTLGVSILLEKLMKQTQVSFNTETTTLDSFQEELVGIAFSWETGKGYYVPCPETRTEAQEWLGQLRPFFENEAIQKISQNLKYDIKILAAYNIHLKGSLFDTMLAHYLINPDTRHATQILANTYLDYEPIAIETLIGKKGKHQKTMRELPLAQQTTYVTEGADIALQLKTCFETVLKETHSQALFATIEIPLLRVLAAMEQEGIRLDTPFLKSLTQALNTDIKTLEGRIYNAAGEVFNIASPKQLGIILFEKLKLIEKPKKTKTGQYATSEDTLRKLAPTHEIVRDILEFRGLSKLKNTYVEALPNQVNPATGRIHTDYMQTVAATGRLSSNNPNLQNIPIRTERGRQVRKAFIPRDENHILLAADYSQIELRIIAALSAEQTMITAFKNNEDIHADTASKIFKTPIASVTREQRSQAKTVNFGIIYGVSAFGLSNQTNLSRSEAKALIDTYYETYPKLQAYIEQQIDYARNHGYVETILGRRRYLKTINSRNAVVRGGAERNAVNAPIQGSAADIIKLAMIKIDEALKSGNYKTKMLLQVHDELVFDVFKPELDTVKKVIKNQMEQAYKLAVPLVVDIGTGHNWLEAH